MPIVIDTATMSGAGIVKQIKIRYEAYVVVKQRVHLVYLVGTPIEWCKLICVQLRVGLR